MKYSWEWRKKLRLKWYDYSNSWYYFVTLCTKWRLDHFGEIENQKNVLTNYGKIAERCWIDIDKHYENIVLDEYIIMPNHIHGIIIVGNEYFRSDSGKGSRSNISNVIKWFKIGVSKEIRQKFNDYEFTWQKSFHDVIIRNEDQLMKSREYIIMNSMKWDEDVNNIYNKSWTINKQS